MVAFATWHSDFNAVNGANCAGIRETGCKGLCVGAAVDVVGRLEVDGRFDGRFEKG